jgi:AraC family transcriptional regulator
MPAPGHRAEYARRLRRVLAHIDGQLAAPLELKDLADVAHFSPYHFHRIFAAWMGETLGDYLRRRRLERAAVLLRSDPALPVLNAALEVGFGSGEAFSRAFKAHFGHASGSGGRRHRLR